MIERQLARLPSSPDRDINTMTTPLERGGDDRIDVFVQMKPDAPKPRAKASSFYFNLEGLLFRKASAKARS